MQTLKTNTHPLQSLEWGEFRKKTGNEIYQGKNFLLTIHKLPLFSNFKIGALIKGPELTSKLLDELVNVIKNEKLLFIRIEPNQILDSNFENEIKKLTKKYNLFTGRRLFTKTTFYIDLTKSEDDLLKDFDSKTRYNIRYAQKKGVVIKEDNSPSAFEKYIELTKETARRQGFYAHSESYHKKMWETLHTQMVSKKKKPIARLLTAIYNNEIITTWIVFVYGNFLYYPYGASVTKYKNVMANNLMMWEAIKYGKKLGLKTFDLWGREENKGFTRFKEGYNPKIVEFVGTWDLTTNLLFYKFYIFIEKLRWFFLRIKSKIFSPKF